MTSRRQLRRRCQRWDRWADRYAAGNYPLAVAHRGVVVARGMSRAYSDLDRHENRVAVRRGDPPPQLLRDIRLTVLARAAHDDTACLAAINRIGALGPHAMCTALATWATQVAQVTGVAAEVAAAAGFSAVEITDRVTGQLVEPEDVPPEVRRDLWWIRFLAAICNDDLATATALFKAVAFIADHEPLRRGIVGIVNMAARTADVLPDGVGLCPRCGWPVRASRRPDDRDHVCY